MSPRLAASVKLADHLGRLEATKGYFFPGDLPLQAGSTLKNPVFAATLDEIARGGADAFYHGPIAADIVTGVNATSTRQNNITLADMAAYRARLRDSVCFEYRAYRVCGMGPPTSGGLTVGQILGMLSNFEVAEMGWSAELAHLLGEVEEPCTCPIAISFPCQWRGC